MSIHDLKTRMADVAGIEALTMGLEAGRILVRWNWRSDLATWIAYLAARWAFTFY
jgi:hypothetical protein